MTPEEMEAQFGGSGGGGAVNTCSLSASNSCSIDSKPTTNPNGSTPKDDAKSKKETDVVASAAAAAATTSSSGNTACPLPNGASPPPPPPDVDYIYHLCQKSNWDEAKTKKIPYFPPTFMAGIIDRIDGRLWFTLAAA